MGAQKCLSLKHYCMSLGHIIVTIFLHNVLFGKRTHPIISNPLQSDILQLSMSNVSASAKGLKAALTMTTATYHWTSIFWCRDHLVSLPGFRPAFDEPQLAPRRFIFGISIDTGLRSPFLSHKQKNDVITNP